MAHQVMKTGFPVYLGNKMRSNFPYFTRQATSGASRYDEGFSCRKARSHTSFRYRATREYNRIPGEIREATTLSVFKTRLKALIKTKTNDLNPEGSNKNYLFLMTLLSNYSIMYYLWLQER